MRVFILFFLLPFSLYPYLLTNFKNPDSILIDEKTGYIYVSNINGSPLARDDNGFISRISPDLKLVTPRFLDGALNEYELDAPKGMAIWEGVLYVADIDTIRGFDLKERVNVQNINLAPYGAKYLNDLAFTPQGELLATDTRINAIFEIKIGKGIQVKKILHSPILANPTGIVALPTGKIYFLSAGKSNIWEYWEGKLERKLGERVFYRYLEDLDYDKDGNIYFTDFSLGRIFRLDIKGRVSTFPGTFRSPGGIAFDRKKNRLMVVEFALDAVRVIDLE